MPEHFIFAVRGIPGDDDRPRRTAREVLSERLSAGVWPLNRQTPLQRSLRDGDQVLVYAAGQGDPDQKHFIASLELAGPLVVLLGGTHTAAELAVTQSAARRFVRIQNGRCFAKGVSIMDVMDQVAFIRNQLYWSVYLQGGVTRLHRKDYELILSKSGTS